MDLSRRTLLVVVSKADILRSLPCGETLRGSASSDAVRQWLADNGMDAALQSFRMDFGTVEYFACDSMHHLPHEDPVSPWRVIPPVPGFGDPALPKKSARKGAFLFPASEVSLCCLSTTSYFPDCFDTINEPI